MFLIIGPLIRYVLLGLRLSFSDLFAADSKIGNASVSSLGGGKCDKLAA